MNYKQTIDFLYSQLPVFHRIGAAAYKANLDNTIALSNYLGNPESKFKSIHIAGTNGKGSVANMLASILQEAGYKTGLCTSPHLRDFRERIRINGKMIPKSYVVRFVKEHKSFFNEIKPSFFEMFISLSFDYFAAQCVDIAVIETGMGGRLDSTNIITPELSVITNIGFDHTAFLGNTIEKIAFEKAGIIKKEVSIVIGRKQKGASNVFEKRAEELNSKLVYANDIFSLSKYEVVFKFNRFWLNILLKHDNSVSGFLCDQWGPYQFENIMTTLSAVKVLNNNGRFYISNDSIKNGLKSVKNNTGFEGRWQFKGKNPRVLFDTGHNYEALDIVMKHINQLNFNKLHIVFGMVDDKDISKMLKLLPKNAVYYLCKPDVPRGLNVETLKEAASKNSLKGNTYLSVKEALANALKNATGDDLIFVGGSTFVVAEVI